MQIDKNMVTMSNLTDDSTSSRKKRDSSLPPNFPARADRTVVEELPEDGSPPKRPKPRGDFHNRVSERERTVVSDPVDDPIEEKYGKGILPTLLALLAVVSIATIGMWLNYQVPSADQLYSEIQSRPPSAVLEECESFMASYPDDGRIDTVKRIHEFGKATTYYSKLTNRLQARKNLIGESLLTEIERQFMEIAELAKSNFEAANIRMDAFVQIHGRNPDLSERDRDCVDAAKSFQLKIREDARKQAKTNLASISYAMEEAAKDTPTEAAKTYRSIIELYGSMNETSNPEVRAMVKDAETLLARIDSGKPADAPAPPLKAPEDE